ncbi:cytochrome b [Rhabdochromatium marinum]|uniref:cytochrome b n=1 Tax=Rhabdochromatium marinum TaxID=48729 RepID=UPI0019068811|nr:cytochrome b [Rhabdochromatium marinum]MBK1648936.1 cytochrome B [Rhabdochromatium marinum]
MSTASPAGLQKYGLVAQAFHWLVALLLLGLLITNVLRSSAAEGSDAFMFWLGLHMSFGILVFVLTFARIFWAKFTPPPELLDAPQWSVLAAKAAHVLLNLSTLVIPVFGYLRIASKDIPANFFGLPVPSLVGEQPWLHHVMEIFHGTPMAIYLVSLVGLHIAAALWHQYVRKDHALERMLPWSPPGA